MTVKRYRIRKSGALRGAVSVPGDKSIGHRALIFSALARGESRITGMSGGHDNRATAQIFQAMGVEMDYDGQNATVQGVGLHGLRMPKQNLDCGNSGTTMRLLSGLLAPQRFGSRLVGDHSLTKRPMSRVIEPLRARGAHIAGASGAKEDKLYPPISIAPLVEGESLAGIEYRMPIASAQVKSCMLLSGLYASGPTALEEPVLSRDHTERMMVSLGVPLQTAGSACVLDPKGEWSGGWDGFEWHVPGDPSSAAFVAAATLMVPDSEVTVTGVGTNPTRTGFFDLLRMMGANAQVMPRNDAAGGEPTADIEVQHGGISGRLLAGELVVRMIDEVPVLAALAATVGGTTEIRDAEELRVKESDRIAVMCKVLGDFGAHVEELDDGMIIKGGAPLTGATVETHGDHRIGMSGALLGMCAEGETVINNAECVDTSFPGFVELFRSLGADITSEEVA